MALARSLQKPPPTNVNAARASNNQKVMLLSAKIRNLDIDNKHELWCYLINLAVKFVLRVNMLSNASAWPGQGKFKFTFRD